MKTFAILFLLAITGWLALDNLNLRNSARDAKNDLADAMDNLKQQADRMDALKAKLANQEGQPPQPAPQPPAQTATTSQTADQLAAAYPTELVIIEGDNAVGSGFLCNMDGRTYIITNIHVLSNNPGLKFRNIQGTAFTVGASALAVEHDVAKLEVTGPAPAKGFDVLPDTSASAKIGDAVIIPGNAEGAGVATQTFGKIVGFGPNLIEVDAPFVKGNSGSPIIHQLTGKVLGVATYTITHKVDPTGRGSVVSEVRHFGYRLDDIKQWQALNWQTFYAQSVQVEAIYTLSKDFISLGGSRTAFNLDPNGFESPALQRSIRRFNDAVRDGSKNMSAVDRKQLVENFVGDLRSLSHTDIIAFDKNTAYDYFRREVEDQDRFREDIYQALTQSLENFR